MKNKGIDVYNILVEQLERLNDLDQNEMSSEVLVNEIKRSEAINKVAAQVVSHSRLMLDAMKFVAEAPDKVKLPDMLNARALSAPEQSK